MLLAKDKQEAIWNAGRPLYTHADPSEVAKYRSVLEGAEYQNIHRLPSFTVEQCRLIGEAAASCTKSLIAERDAATQRADAAERKLASVTEYVQGMVSAAGNQPSVATGYIRDILDALLSASAEPAKGGYGEAEQ